MDDRSQLEAVMQHPPRVEALRRVLAASGSVADLIVDGMRPYVDGTDNLPADGRFLLVGNHTQAGAEIFLIPYAVNRAIGVRVRPLADRNLGRMRGLAADLAAAYGAVVGAPDAADELMRHDQTVLVFPGGGREIPKFKGEEYALRWQGRAGFARVAVANGYPIVPVALVGGDDVYRSVISRDSAMGRLSEAIGGRLTGRSGMAMPLMRGIGPTLIPRPQRMYLRFGSPIDTSTPVGVDTPGWVTAVKQSTQAALEEALADLLALREDDPFRDLNPLARRRARQPA
ncbi:1-acyl-sn-glycerol-3-phosphate acyltransferase [Mycolicibacterium sp. CBM1]